jgi:hypothetical protein
VDEVELAWAALAADFALDRAEDASGAALDLLREGLVAAFAAAGVADAADRVELPAQYGRFLALAGGTWHHVHPDETGADIPYHMHFYGAGGALSATEIESDLNAEYRDPDASLWLVFGHWSDKHLLLLNCDRRDPAFGAVVDVNDGHPWLGGGADDVEADSFAGYLRHLRESWDD